MRAFAGRCIPAIWVAISRRCATARSAPTILGLAGHAAFLGVAPMQNDLRKAMSEANEATLRRAVAALTPTLAHVRP